MQFDEGFVKKVMFLELAGQGWLLLLGIVGRFSSGILVGGRWGSNMRGNFKKEKEN